MIENRLPFIKTDVFFGPDRRRRQELIDEPDRRKEQLNQIPIDDGEV